MKRIYLFPGREKLALNRHPWLYSGALAPIKAPPAAGEIVEVWSSSDTFIAYGQYNPHSKIRVRLMEWNLNVSVDLDWFRSRVREAWDLRKGLLARTNAFRVIFSESDGLPGLIVDRFDAYLVVQFLTSGADAWRPFLPELLLAEIPGVVGVYEKSDGDGRRMENLPASEGHLLGETLPQSLEIREDGRRYIVNPASQKTGFYTDQRDNRTAIAPWLKGLRVLDAFCFTGGFAVAAMQAGAAQVTLLDSSADALAQAQDNLKRGGWSAAESLQADAFQALRDLQKRGQTYQAIVLDPPKLASSREHLNKALRGYKDLNLQALKLLEPGGYLASFSCSGLVDMKTFREMIAFAAKDSGRRVDIVLQLHQASCHPVRTSMPEAEYLKGTFLRVL